MRYRIRSVSRPQHTVKRTLSECHDQAAIYIAAPWQHANCRTARVTHQAAAEVEEKDFGGAARPLCVELCATRRSRALEAKTRASRPSQLQQDQLSQRQCVKSSGKDELCRHRDC